MFLIASVKYLKVLGPSPIITKSTFSSCKVFSGRAVGWMPEIAIGILLNCFIAFVIFPAGYIFRVDDCGVEPWEIIATSFGFISMAFFAVSSGE